MTSIPDPTIQMPDHPTSPDPVADDRARAEIEIPRATGAARGGVDVAELGARHLARSIVCAVADGAAEDPALRPLLRELAEESERLSGAAVVLHTQLGKAERAAGADGDRDQAAVLLQLQAVHEDGVLLHDTAKACRLRLPARYGDPHGLES